MRSGICGLLMGYLVSVTVFAQGGSIPVANPGDKICWDQPGMSLLDVQSLSYYMQFDGGAAPPQPTAAASGKPRATGPWTVQVNAACEGSLQPFQCATVIPPELSAGEHTVIITTTRAGQPNSSSDPFIFAYTGKANYKPTNIRITK